MYACVCTFNNICLCFTIHSIYPVMVIKCSVFYLTIIVVYIYLQFHFLRIKSFLKDALPTPSLPPSSLSLSSPLPPSLPLSVSLSSPLPPSLPYRQSVFIALLVKLGALPNSWKEYDMDDVALSLQNFLICIEMLIAAIAHYFVFSHKPFIDPAAAQVNTHTHTHTHTHTQNTPPYYRYHVWLHVYVCWM